MGAQGSGTIDFGSAPGSTVATFAIVGQAGIVAGSHVECFLQGTDTTATHNAVEHSMVPITIRPNLITVATGFSGIAISAIRLTGTFTYRWVWN